MAALLCRLSSNAHAGIVSRHQGCCAALSGRKAVPPRRMCTRQLTQCTAAAQGPTAMPAASRNKQAKETRALSGDDPDVTIECSDGEEVYAHATIMRIASPFWREELEEVDADDDGMAELEDEDASSELMEVLLCRLYPIYPKSEINWENVEELSHLAHKRNVECVLRDCEAFLVHELSDDSSWQSDCHDCKGCGDCIMAEIEQTVNLLQLSQETGMDALAKSCDKRLRDVNGLGQQLANDECLDALSATTLRKLVKMLASGSK